MSGANEQPECSCRDPPYCEAPPDTPLGRLEAVFAECWEAMQARTVGRGVATVSEAIDLERAERLARLCETDPAARPFIDEFFADVAAPEVDGAVDRFVDVNAQRSHAQRLALGRRQRAVWVPIRCENAGCRVKDPKRLRPCKRCGVVFYCGEACRDEDRAAGHGAECEALAMLQLEAIPFRSADELRKWPLRVEARERLPSGWPHDAPEVEEGCGPRQCFVCGGDEDVELAPCCGIPVCRTVEGGIYDDPDDNCARFHATRSLCGLHWHERHTSSPDFRTCPECRARYDAQPWRCPEGVTGACATPLLEISVPQGKRYTAECSMEGCFHRILPGVDAAAGPDADGFLACPRCALWGGVGNEVDAYGLRKGESWGNPLDRDRAIMRQLARQPVFQVPDRQGGI